MFNKYILIGVLSWLTITPVWADSLDVTVDTSSLAGQSGWLDLQFNPGDVTSPAATALVSLLQTDGSLLPTPVLTGDASGGLASQVSFDNNQFFNDYQQQFTFGNTLSFDLSWTMPSPSTDSTLAGTAFSLTLFDAKFNTLLADPIWNASLVFNLNSDGSTSILAQSNAVALTTPAAVPLPGSVGLLMSGIVFMFGSNCMIRRPKTAIA